MHLHLPFCKYQCPKSFSCEFIQIFVEFCEERIRLGFIKNLIISSFGVNYDLILLLWYLHYNTHPLSTIELQNFYQFIDYFLVINIEFYAYLCAF